ncbi:MAG: AAA family ATPase [Candidatus Acetothermia bacterium]|jgi:BioD-like phosphotransacetylase family protein|nr:AAA family ATPase [Candidatus Acetothermia bacterium]
MKKLYIAGVEEKAGKTALAMGLARRMRCRGMSVAYRKPVGWANAYRQGRPFDQDAEVAAAALGLAEPPEAIVPVLGGQVPRVWRPPAEAWARIDALATVDADVLILEGREWLGRGLLSGMSDMAVAARLGASVLLVARYRGEPTVDRVLAAVRIVASEVRLVGAVLNEVSPDTELEEVRGFAVPFLEERGVPVLGVIPFERQLHTVRIREVIDALGAEVVVEGNQAAEVERFLVGAMGGDAALRYLRRIPGQLAVVTGGDRTDIQAAALASPRVRAIILSGGLRPERAIVTQAVGRGVTLAVAPQDTMTVAETAERLVGRTLQVGEPQLALLDRMVAEGVELERLLELL